MTTYKYFYIILAVIVAVLVVAAGVVHYRLQSSLAQQGEPDAATAERVNGAYRALATPPEQAGRGAQLENALEQFRDIAADETNSDLARAQALNGINYAYTESSFDAQAVYNAVFSKPPFSSLYVAATSTHSAPDPLHPESPGDVVSVEAALVKLNELSNTLNPNHYAISRMEIANVFAYQREVTTLTDAKARLALRKSYALKVKELADEYIALPVLQSSPEYSYAMPMRLQIMFAHASALAFEGITLGYGGAMKRSEALFKDTIQTGETYLASNTGDTLVLSKVLLARIFYASYFWNTYKQTDPNRIFDILRPMTDVAKVKDTFIYTDYLPSQKNATSGTFLVLREIAQRMPELKTFLQGRGWVF